MCSWDKVSFVRNPFVAEIFNKVATSGIGQETDSARLNRFRVLGNISGYRHIASITGSTGGFDAIFVTFGPTADIERFEFLLASVPCVQDRLQIRLVVSAALASSSGSRAMTQARFMPSICSGWGGPRTTEFVVATALLLTRLLSAEAAITPCDSASALSPLRFPTSVGSAAGFYARATINFLHPPNPFHYNRCSPLIEPAATGHTQDGQKSSSRHVAAGFSCAMHIIERPLRF